MAKTRSQTPQPINTPLDPITESTNEHDSSGLHQLVLEPDGSHSVRGETRGAGILGFDPLSTHNHRLTSLETKLGGVEGQLLDISSQLALLPSLMEKMALMSNSSGPHHDPTSLYPPSFSNGPHHPRFPSPP